MDPDIKEKIDKLLQELRSWDVGEQRYTCQELAEMFDLTKFIVKRLADAEGIDVPEGPEPADPNAVTKPIDIDEETDTNPDGVVEDS